MPKRPWAPSAAWMSSKAGSSPAAWPFRSRPSSSACPTPRGVLIVGIQGTGKSLCAKAISQQWHMPLLRLDVGRLMGSYVGESEARTREMIQIAEAMAPCVLWIDEVDKGFAGIGGVQGDSGAQARVFGSLITWMQEKEIPRFHRRHSQ
ncbi:MAG: AAA family ATPase [Angelakisella sp.]